MADQVKIEITSPKHLTEIGIFWGMAMLNDTLEKHPAKDKIAGFGLAQALVAQAMTEQRIQMFSSNVRLAVKSGIDLDTHRLSLDGPRTLVAEPYDLVEISEGAA